MSDILLEVDDELRSQQLKAFWTRYGQWLIGLALAAVLGTALGVFWHGHKNRQLQAETTKLYNVVQTGADGKVAPEAVQKLIPETSYPLKGIAKLHLARIYEQNGNAADARKTYADIADDSNLDEIVRDLALLQNVRLGMVAGDNLEALLSRIEPLTKEGRAFRGSAMELQGVILRQKGDHVKANEIFKTLSDDATTPNSIRQRARNLIDYGAGHAK